MQQIYSHLSQPYLDLHISHANGAYYYSKELVENIVPKIKTNRPWVTIYGEGMCADNAIMVIHNNAHPERYDWIDKYNNLILICSTIKTLKVMIKNHPKCHVIYVPLSIDTKYVKQFKAKRKTKDTCYFGRKSKCPESILENDKIDKLYGKDREALLKQLAKYKKAYAIGRCAIEAKCLGCKVIPHEGEYENVDFELLDNKDVIPELQRLLNEIDGVS